MNQRRTRRRVVAVPFLSGRRPAVESPVLTAALSRIDAGDTWATELSAGDSRDAAWWNTAVFGTGPAWSEALMRLRNALVRLLRLDIVEGDDTARGGFPRIADDLPRAILTGEDGAALSFRCLILVEGDRVSVTTLVRLDNRVGRIYWSVVRLFHPRIVRAAIARVPVG